MQIFFYTAFIGFFLLLLSLFGGGDADADADGNFHWIDLHLLGNFLTAFGSVGILISYVGGMNEMICYGAAFLAGILAAYFGKTVIRLLRKFGNPGTDSFSYVGLRGFVSTPIKGKSPGEVFISVSGRKNYYLQAYSASGEEIPSGAEVVILDSVGNAVKVCCAEAKEKADAAK